MTIRNEYVPNYAVHPGRILLDVLETRKITQVELAKRTGISTKHISQIINGLKPVTPTTALSLERVLGTPAYVWSNLNARYQLFQTERERIKLDENKENKEWVNKFPITWLKKNGYIDNKKAQKGEIVNQVLSFFGVANKESFDPSYGACAINYRKTSDDKSSSESVATWIRVGELKTLGKWSNNYNRDLFESNLAEIKKLIKYDVENDSIDKMKKLCADSGVVFVIVQGIPKTGCWGATKWLSKNKVMLLLSLRNRYDDFFWFTFFHEAGHIILHKNDEIIIDTNGIEKNNNLNEKEEEANKFARKILIPDDAYESFKDEIKPILNIIKSTDTNDLKKFTKTNDLKKEIIKFAESNNIAPSIVLGRLQFDDLIDYRTILNDLKKSINIEGVY